MPNNFLLIGVIRQALPAARIIFCHRDPREHAAALFSKYYAQSGNGYAAALDDALAYLSATDRLRTAFAQRFPSVMFSLDTGRLRQDPLSAQKDIAAFLGLPPPDAALELTAADPRLGADPARSTAGKAALLRAIDALLAPPAVSA